MSQNHHNELRARVANLPQQPGVYRMLDAQGVNLYIGKARDLRRRVSSYFTRSLNARLQQMIAKVVEIEITLTRSDSEALLLENELIKTHRPRFNVLLRDDKSYPYLYLSTHDVFPRLAFYRGKRRAAGRYFGPYPSSAAVRETLQLLQKLFPVRQCRDHFYRQRTRPCLQYQIKRCTAPCVGLIDPPAYAEDVQRTIQFLTGRTDEVISGLSAQMEQAAAVLEYEQAAVFRDRIATLRRIQHQQSFTNVRTDVDLVAIAQAGGQSCVQVFFIRAGRNLGNRAFFPDAPADASAAMILGGFLAQFYAQHPPPPEILLSTEPEDGEFLSAALSQQAGRKVMLSDRLRGERAQWIALAHTNAESALRARLAQRANYAQQLAALGELLMLEKPPQRIECFDVSHTQGERAVASCVVFDHHGACQSEFRRFNLDDIPAGDDYAALEQAVRRRYQRIENGEFAAPDVLLIDGGRGQINRVAQVLTAQGWPAGLALVGIAKGKERIAGAEQLWCWGADAPIHAPQHTPVNHLLQQIRDAAHRLALTGHRRRRNQARQTSVLETIPGIGAARRRKLLTAFGGLQELKRASVEDIARVDGISKPLAQTIYQALHPGH